MLRCFREWMKRIPGIGPFIYYFYLRLFYDKTITADATYRWITLLRSNELLRQLALKRPSFATKPLGDYLNMKYRFSERVHSLRSHYEFVLSRIPKNQLVSILFEEGLVLAEFLGKSGASYRVTLGTHSASHNEGELLLQLENAENQIISFVIFNVGSINGKPRIEVGCLQGAVVPWESILTKMATKDFYSTRPKHLIMALLYELSRCWNIDSIACIKTIEQVKYNRGNNPEFYADYDRFWEELGGIPDDSGFYIMPAQLSHRDKATIRKDRAKDRRHRLRLELKNSVFATVRTTLDYPRGARLEVLPAVKD
jgi:uncharacterized protein VirK/YbjX